MALRDLPTACAMTDAFFFFFFAWFNGGNVMGISRRPLRKLVKVRIRAVHLWRSEEGRW